MSTRRLCLYLRQAANSWNRMPPVLREREHRFPVAPVAAYSLRARAVGVSHGFDRRSYVYASAPLSRPVDATTGKQMPEPPDAQFACASLYALLLPDRLHSSAVGCGETRVF
jgi:hypothetical protein